MNSRRKPSSSSGPRPVLLVLAGATLAGVVILLVLSSLGVAWLSSLQHRLSRLSRKIDPPLGGAQDQCDFAGAYSEHNGCVYSTAEQVHFFAEIDEISPNELGVCQLFYYGLGWSTFPKRAPYHTFVANEADRAADPFLSRLEPLKLLGRSILDNPSLNPGERLALNAVLANVEFIANTSALNWGHAFEYDVNGYWWWPSGPECVGMIGDTLASGDYVGEANYESAVLNYMTESVAAVSGTRQYLLDLLAAPGLPRVLMGAVAADYADVWDTYGDLTYLQDSYCGQGFDGAELTQCLALAQQLATAFDAFKAVWNGPWLAACNTHRPDSAPSAAPLPDYSEAYAIAYSFYTGDDISTLPSMLEYLIRQYYKSYDASNDLFSEAPFSSYGNYANWVSVSATNYADPLLFDCWGHEKTPEKSRAYMQLMWELARDWQEYPLYADDNPAAETYVAAGRNAFYTSGSYDYRRAQWNSGGIGHLPLDPVANATCAQLGLSQPCTCLSLKLPAWIHELVGHAFAIPTAAKLQCGTGYFSAFSFTEGWAAYTDRRFGSLDVFRQKYPMAYLNEFALDRTTILGGPVADAWNFLYQNLSLAECTQINFDAGYGSMGRSRARCIRVMGGMAGQQFTYQRGSQVLAQQRAIIEAMTGSNFDPKLFHKPVIVFEFMLDSKTFTEMVPTLAAIMNNDPNARNLPHFDLLARYVLQNNQVLARDYDPFNSCGRTAVQRASTAAVSHESAAVSASRQTVPA